jgi:hypothetical protein
MKTTKRVGDPDEDPSMAEMRSKLARINACGFVTVDSQMGIKTSGPTCWQRAYISGFVSNEMAPKLVAVLERTDGIIALASPHGEDQPRQCANFAYKRMPKLPLTLDGVRLQPVTTRPLAEAEPFDGSMWIALLPELGLANDKASMAAVRREVTQVFVMDTVWGRKRSLFSKVLKALRGLAA